MNIIPYKKSENKILKYCEVIKNSILWFQDIETEQDNLKIFIFAKYFCLCIKNRVLQKVEK